MLHDITLHDTTLHYIKLALNLHSIPSHQITLRCSTLHYVALLHTTLRYVAFHYITLHYITLHCITSHHITSHHITYIHIIHIHIGKRHLRMTFTDGWGPCPHPLPPARAPPGRGLAAPPSIGAPHRRAGTPALLWPRVTQRGVGLMILNPESNPARGCGSPNRPDN